VQGDDARARVLLTRAVALAPRDSTAREALKVVRGGGVVDIDALNARLLSTAQRIAAG
jgi:Flp pilus assembly protein TadD